MNIKKATGEYQPFEQAKLRESLMRTGTPDQFAKDVIKQAEKQEKSLRTTDKLFDFTQQMLIKRDKKAAMRYRLKRGMFDLGPTGFPFEKYVARLLRDKGYNTQTGIYVRGFCVSHEVDILAEKNKEIRLFECKYHLRKGSRSNIKVALYVKARFEDIAKGYQEDNNANRMAPKKNIKGAYLVTNTKCTSEAIKFAQCAGLGIISWRYPFNQGLESMIESSGLYPITVLLSINSIIKRRLLSLGVVTVQDILSFGYWDRIPRHEQRFIGRLQEEARILLA
ncbi:MAG: hypothetical protein WC734_01455 [Patescibacteria group bacterium]|jgi:hypothetical protein